jgi:pyruvate carboxylase
MERGRDVTVELEPGKALVIKFLTVGEPHPDGTRTVFFELNGQPREVTVRDRSLDVKEAAKPKADPAQPGHIGAPIPGVISTVAVELNQAVKKGDRLLVLEAMKMQSTVYSPVGGMVKQLLAHPGQHVEAKDLLLVIE